MPNRLQDLANMDWQKSEEYLWDLPTRVLGSKAMEHDIG